MRRICCWPAQIHEIGIRREGLDADAIRRCCTDIRFQVFNFVLPGQASRPSWRCNLLYACEDSPLAILGLTIRVSNTCGLLTPALHYTSPIRRVRFQRLLEYVLSNVITFVITLHIVSISSALSTRTFNRCTTIAKSRHD